jgi:hypothetical protein
MVPKSHPLYPYVRGAALFPFALGVTSLAATRKKIFSSITALVSMSENIPHAARQSPAGRAQVVKFGITGCSS